MEWWLILIIIVLAVALLLTLASLHPIRLWVEGSAAETLSVQVVLKPFGIFPGKFKLVDIVDRPWGGAADKDEAETAEKKEKKQKTAKGGTKKPPLAREDILPLLDKLLGSIAVEDLDLQANLSGDPYHSGVACGVLWTFFGGGFAFLSHRVKKFTNHPKMNFGVDLNRPWSAYFRLRLMIRLGGLGKLGFLVLAAIIRRRREQKQIADTAAAVEN